MSTCETCQHRKRDAGGHYCSLTARNTREYDQDSDCVNHKPITQEKKL